MSTEFVKQLNPHPATDEVREAVLQNPGFGKHFTDHMVCIDWHRSSVLYFDLWSGFASPLSRDRALACVDGR